MGAQCVSFLACHAVGRPGEFLSFPRPACPTCNLVECEVIAHVVDTKECRAVQLDPGSIDMTTVRPPQATAGARTPR